MLSHATACATPALDLPPSQTKKEKQKKVARPAKPPEKPVRALPTFFVAMLAGGLILSVSHLWFPRRLHIDAEYRELALAKVDAVGVYPRLFGGARHDCLCL